MTSLNLDYNVSVRCPFLVSFPPTLVTQTVQFPSLSVVFMQLVLWPPYELG